MDHVPALRHNSSSTTSPLHNHLVLGSFGAGTLMQPNSRGRPWSRHQCLAWDYRFCLYDSCGCCDSGPGHLSGSGAAECLSHCLLVPASSSRCIFPLFAHGFSTLNAYQHKFLNACLGPPFSLQQQQATHECVCVYCHDVPLNGH